jgi:hypothetical protein
VEDLVVQKDTDNITSLEAELKDGARETVQHVFKLPVGDRLQSGARRADGRLIGIHPALKQDGINDIHCSSDKVRGQRQPLVQLVL